MIWRMCPAISYLIASNITNKLADPPPTPLGNNRRIFNPGNFFKGGHCIMFSIINNLVFNSLPTNCLQAILYLPIFLSMVFVPGSTYPTTGALPLQECSTFQFCQLSVEYQLLNHSTLSDNPGYIQNSRAFIFSFT